MRASVPALGLTVALTVGCTEPHFGAHELDGGHGPADATVQNPLVTDAREPLVSDDAQQPDPQLAAPLWAEHLLGDYAIRLRLFGTASGNLVTVSHETISVLQVKFDPERKQVLWTMQMCRDHADAELVPGTVAGVRYPELYPPRDLHVLFADGEFGTDGDGPAPVGYSELAPPGCEPGKTLPAGAGQRWLASGTCDCPLDTSLPSSPTDCRLNDSDADGHPGFTVSLMGTIDGNDYCVTRDDSQVIHGKIDPQGHHSALYVIRQNSYQVQCAGGSCTRAAFTPCAGPVNAMEFAPLEGRADGALWTCADMLRAVDVGALLPDDPLIFPDPTKCNP